MPPFEKHRDKENAKKCQIEVIQHIVEENVLEPEAACHPEHAPQDKRKNTTKSSDGKGLMNPPIEIFIVRLLGVGFVCKEPDA